MRISPRRPVTGCEMAGHDGDTIARLGRAPAVTLVAATQRPTQEVMGQGAARSQMNVRIAFRVEEQRDVDLIPGQGRQAAGWHARKRNAPGKSLISSPEHDTPRRARACLLTDDDVTAAARYAPARPRLDDISRRPPADAPPPACPAVTEPGTPGNGSHAGSHQTAGPAQGHETASPRGDDYRTAETALRAALSHAGPEGAAVGEPVAMRGTGRSWVHGPLAGLARAGRAVQVPGGMWRASRPVAITRDRDPRPRPRRTRVRAPARTGHTHGVDADDRR